MSRIRYIIVISIVIITAILLQYLRIINISEIFGITASQNSEAVPSKALPTGSPVTLAKPDYLYVLYSESDAGNIQIPGHLQNILRNTHIASEFIDVTDADMLSQIESIPSGSKLVLATEQLDQIPGAIVKILEQKVASGSYLTMTLRSFSSVFQDLAGITAKKDFINDILGLSFTKQFFPGLDSIEIPEELIVSSSLEVTLSDDVELLAVSEKGHPLIWTHPWGEGQVLYTNSTLFQDKLNRGLLLQMILQNSDYMAATFLNAKMLNIDDFPGPIPSGFNEAIYKDYQRNIRKFYKEILWPDLRELSARYNLKMTGLLIGTYNSETKPPFSPIPEDYSDLLEYYGRKLAEEQGEIGIHGYNHNALAEEGELLFEQLNYSPWADKAAMTASLNVLKNTLQTIYGDLTFRTYVAPSNLIGAQGKAAVLEVFPDIKIFAGVYNEMEQNIPGFFIQEFGKDPDFPGIYNFPRFSSGYTSTAANYWAIFNAIAELGVFNHFIHPDDILDPERSQNASWQELIRGLDTTIRDVVKYFPSLEPYTVYELYKKYLTYENLEIKTTRDNNRIIISCSDTSIPVYTYVHVDSIITGIQGAVIIPTGREKLYILKITSPTVTIEIEGF